MTNLEICNEFTRILLESPDHVLQAVQLRLSATDYELKLLKADPCRMHHEKNEGQQMHLSFLEQVEETFQRR